MPRGAAKPKKTGGTGAKRGPAPAAHKLAKEFPQGTVLRDLFKNDWQLGSVIGKGGFGLIYLASEGHAHGASLSGLTAEHVIKIEPKGNGPLYCEVHFYQRVAKEADIKEFTKRHKLHYLPIPPFIAFGVHTEQLHDYRFLVMPRFGTDLQRLLVDQGGTFPPHVVFGVGLRMIDALQYMHEKKYYHGDIKAANILLGHVKGRELPNRVYLVDYGLAQTFAIGDAHKEYKEDPRKAHDGTIEFTSRDAHRGVAPSRRGDFEILGYCLLQWLYGPLPWENNLKDPNAVAQSKEKFMGNVASLVLVCGQAKGNPPAAGHSNTIRQYLDHVNRLKYDEEPNYDQFRKILRSGLHNAGVKDEWNMDFTSAVTKAGTKRKKGDGDPGSPSPAKKPTPKGRQTQNGRPKPVRKSPVKKTSTTTTDSGDSSSSPRKQGRSPKKSPVSKSPAAGTGRRKTPVKSPMASLSRPSLKVNGRSPAATTSRRPVGAKPKKRFPMPPPTKPTAKSPKASARSPIAANPIRRKVKRAKAVQSDAAIQTSPMTR